VGAMRKLAPPGLARGQRPGSPSSTLRSTCVAGCTVDTACL
jgi:hypothetical protein